jgi:ABC-2 type transport system permease protein
MNILKRELRAGLKPFIFWIIGMFLLVFIGIAKFQGVSAAGSDFSELLASFPRIVLALMGIVGLDISTLGGYSAILFYYVLICAIIYSVHLGSNAVSRESVDKTYEFVFSKPCSRGRVLAMKLLAGWLYLLLFCALVIVFSLAAVASLKTAESIKLPTLLFALSIFLLGSLFIALSAFFASAARRPEKGSLYGNLAFLYAFTLGVVYNMLEHPGILKLISPFTYYIPADLIANKFDLPYTGLTLLLTAASLYGAFTLFKKKDLTYSV